MDENRLERLKELVDQIEPENDLKERILENVKYRKRRKGNRFIKYAAAAALAVFICGLAANYRMRGGRDDRIVLNVYASELNGDNWMALPVGEKRKLSRSNKTSFGYIFSLEIPDGYECYYRDLGAMIGMDLIFHDDNTIRWFVYDDEEFDFPDYMDTDLNFFMIDEEGNKAGKYRIIMSRENGEYYVEILDETGE